MNWHLALKHHLQELIKIDTTNPPGNEIGATLYLARHLEQADIPYEIFEPIPGRGSIVARLRGNGNKAPLMLLAHLDVVSAVASDWSVHPFSGQEVNGTIIGRGAIDTKNLVATWLTLLLKIKAEGHSLQRDIIFAATADEETGGQQGLGWIANNRPDLVDCEYALNEGGGNALSFAGKTYLTLQSGEKSGVSIEMKVNGTAGHASIPISDNSVLKLADSLLRLGQAQLPFHRTATVDSFVQVIAEDLGMPVGSMSIEQIAGFMLQATSNPFEQAGIKAMLSNTAVPTMLQASQKLNVVPGSALARLDGRILPGQTGSDLVNELKAVLPSDVELTAAQHLLATESSVDTELARVIAELVPQHLPGAKLVPFLLPGTTDARFLRPRGVTVYGFAPMLAEERVDLAHGVDERISLRSLNFGFDLLEQVVKKMVF